MNVYDVGSELLVRQNFAWPAAEGAVVGDAIDITTLPGNPRGLAAYFAASLNDAESGDTLTVSAFKIQSSADSAFTTPVDRVTAGTSLVVTGLSGDSNTERNGQARLDLNLQTFKAANPTHKWVRLAATLTRSDTTNTTGACAGIAIFSGLGQAPQQSAS